MADVPFFRVGCGLGEKRSASSFCQRAVFATFSLVYVSMVPPQQFFVSFHFYLFHVSPHHEYLFLPRVFVGYCLCCHIFPHPPSARATKPGSIDGPDDCAVARPPRRPSHDCGNRSRPADRSSLIFRIFGHDHHSGHACGVADDDNERGVAPRAVRSLDNWAGAGGILSYGDGGDNPLTTCSNRETHFRVWHGNMFLCPLPSLHWVTECTTH